jgi:hypothetical protein
LSEKEESMVVKQMIQNYPVVSDGIIINMGHKKKNREKIDIS